MLDTYAVVAEIDAVDGGWAVTSINLPFRTGGYGPTQSEAIEHARKGIVEAINTHREAKEPITLKPVFRCNLNSSLTVFLIQIADLTPIPAQQ